MTSLTSVSCASLLLNTIFHTQTTYIKKAMHLCAYPTHNHSWSLFSVSCMIPPNSLIISFGFDEPSVHRAKRFKLKQWLWDPHTFYWSTNLRFLHQPDSFSRSFQSKKVDLSPQNIFMHKPLVYKKQCIFVYILPTITLFWVPHDTSITSFGLNEQSDWRLRGEV